MDSPRPARPPQPLRLLSWQLAAWIVIVASLAAVGWTGAPRAVIPAVAVLAILAVRRRLHAGHDGPPHPTAVRARRADRMVLRPRVAADPDDPTVVEIAVDQPAHCSVVADVVRVGVRVDDARHLWGELGQVISRIDSAPDPGGEPPF